MSDCDWHGGSGIAASQADAPVGQKPPLQGETDMANNGREACSRVWLTGRACACILVQPPIGESAALYSCADRAAPDLALSSTLPVRHGKLRHIGA